MKFPNYILSELVHEGRRILVYRGVSELNRQPVMIKTLKADFPTLKEIAQLKQEYQILVSLSIPGVIKTYGWERSQNRWALILEDGGISLKEFAEGNWLRLDNFLTVAIQITSALGEIHQQRIIHKDIKPKNILIHPQTQEIKLIDFSISSQLPEENSVLRLTNQIEGTLSYLSPEQTGRMNRLSDRRSDLYSLGVTFYELLTGALPFASSDPLELIHCHIAIQPIPPHEVRQDMPIALSELVMKLLAKNPEDRYQSAFGVKADLETIQTQLQSGAMVELAIAQHDISGQLLIPQKLYGRDAEITTLLAAFARVTSRDSTPIELVLVSGYSGIGKSSLVNEIHKPILQQRGYFISGKFDQFQRDIPYASLTQAFQTLIQQLLTESTANLEAWKNKLLKALGQNAQVMSDLIPEVELIIGVQPPVPQLPAVEAQNRFNQVLREFIQVFAQPEHPLVLFLDDLQWADLASLKLLQALMQDASCRNLLLLGAYRDHEVELHPLMQIVEEMQRSGARVSNIVLQPLQLENVQQLLTETFREDAASEQLATLIFQKTQGNPFFVIQLLQSLVQENLICFDFDSAHWQWDFEQIQMIGVTDNVVDLMIAKIQKLPEETRTLLKLAACIGNSFDLETLLIIYENSSINTARDLWSALQERLVIPLSNAYKVPLVVGEETAGATTFELVNYKFLHDRVQQAAYALIPEIERKATHLKIGQRLQQSQSAEAQKENIFELVNQLNYGIDLISSQAERDQLAALNFIAGQKAKASIAYEPATRYLNLGLELLSVDSWLLQYDLTLNLHESAIITECINANYTRSQALIDTALAQTKHLLDRVRIYKCQIQLDIAKADLPASINTALTILKLLGVPIPTETEKIQQYCQQLRLELVFEQNAIAALANLPVLSNPIIQAALEILNTMPGPVYIVRPELFMPMMLTMTRLSVQYGNWVPSSFAYCIYGVLSCGFFAEIDTGYAFGQLSLRVLEQFNNMTLYPQVLKVYSSHIHHTKNHIRSTIELFESAIDHSVETGNIEFLGYGASEQAIHLLLSGENLVTVNQKVLPKVELVEGFQQGLGIYYIRIARQMVLNLMGEADNPLTLTGESFSEATMLPVVEAANWKTLLCCFHLFKLMLAYMLGDIDTAIAQAELTAVNLDGVLGMVMQYEYLFYHSLSLLAQCDRLGASEKEQLLNQVHANQDVLKLRAIHAPMNFQHKYDLVAAETARVLGQRLVAMDYYDASIESARNHGYLHGEALANELAAKFYLSIHKEKIAKTYLRDAYQGYVSWGCLIKEHDLATRYPNLLKPNTPEYMLQPSLSEAVTATSALLDLSTAVKASVAIASELILENLLNELIKIAIENAGADTGILIAKLAGEFVVEVAGTVEQNQVVALITANVQFPLSILNYVDRTQEMVVINDATCESRFLHDAYITTYQPKSVLCIPILLHGQLQNLLYLENSLTTGAFTRERLEVLGLLSTQIAVSLENARLYRNLANANTQLENYAQTLEATVAERTLDLQAKTTHLEQTKIQLEASNQELEAFSSSVSHDLRAPLRRINFFTNWLTQSTGSELNEQSQDYLRRIVNSTQEMEQLIEGLLRLSRINRSEMHRQSVNVSAIVQSIAQTLQKDEPNRCVKFQIEMGITANVDTHLLKAALENLLGNASKFTRHRDLALIEFGVFHSEQHSTPVFFIRDNGVGFDMTYVDKLFIAFQRLHSSFEFEGSGIGLATVARIIQRHQGKIWAESTVGQGTTFYFTLEKGVAND